MSPPAYQSGTTPPPRWRNRVRWARERAGITQAELARRAGLERSNLALVESGRRVPSVTTLLRVARALGVPVDALIDVEASDWTDTFTPFCGDQVVTFEPRTLTKESV